jgi:hypothetical protein
MQIESSDGKPYNPNREYGICTCAKTGCVKRIRYPAIEGSWRPRYCREHLEEEAVRIVNTGRTERDAYEATHVQMNGIVFKSMQEQL